MLKLNKVMNDVELGEFGFTMSYGSVAVTVRKEVRSIDYSSCVD